MKKKIVYLLLLLCSMSWGCKKDFLDTRPNKALLVPTTLDDLRLLLNNNQVFNIAPELTSLADGDYFTDEAGLQTYNLDMERNSYIWAKDIFGTEPNFDWANLYKEVFYANIVLEGLNKLPADQQSSAEGREIRGTALFFRAVAFYQLAGMFAAPYSPENLAQPGIPVRLHADVTERVDRGKLGDVYAQVLKDLALARTLLPETVTVKTRPTLNALWAMRARIALTMKDYTLAGRYGDSVLAAKPPLLDYNTLNPAAARPFPRVLPYGNAEVLWHESVLPYSFDPPSAATWVVPELYNSYATDDLRKTLFFRLQSPGRYSFRGNYAGVLTLFAGLATDEVYLIRAESRARAGNVQGAMDDLNSLLVTRWRTGTFIPFAAADPTSALALVLAERRKELLGRGLRWADVRRLNLSIERTANGQVYRLEAGSPRYVYPIPDDEIRLNGLVQNER
ncbi:RagB/SusD family nutrient uptake outer membrane protein [Mucilaginibacter achroorhodeus]|uniref:RagB/SusD family nutrient uptake outer membrane protein n=1 Tax=Mucilaginibacter achroorhodeus TaxID=2599294 RepID=A0A563U609_9SPHI|nr:RagB/SusD family nutrient uptake outer membrane protein [Mucilaginibacter achroorhodeus]TWR26782.1 RagB/SusD family nutrient uptake outer membrane protein [Mucilaginibacter achroorhodeus]